MTLGLRTQSTSNRFALNFVPPTLPGCVLWLRADKGITLDGSSNVSFWADQSGAGHSVQSVSPSQNPSYSGSAGPNGTAYLGFQDASTQALSGTFAPAYPFDTFIVCRMTTATTVRYICDFAAINNNCALVTQPGPILWNFPFTQTTGAKITQGADFVAEGVSTGTGTSSAVNINNGPSPVAGTTNSGATGKTVIGNRADFPSNSWNGRIYEVVVYSRVLNPPERAMLCRYFGARYSFGVP